ncbi:hypothetical protein P4O66_002824 [Electrophorus voltai]|uniref:Uncharacterized protein n=1 Tax=Electrophorus voltai TaxID=2609070 RepID=A0AAD9DMN0_9TELE|nr:hypothetical protein P4O66_002824 [Electrophorus voltai]
MYYIDLKFDDESMFEGSQSGPHRPTAFSSNAAASSSAPVRLDNILSPPCAPFRKTSNPEVSCGFGAAIKFKHQLSEDGKQLRRGSLGGALTGKYLLPYVSIQQAWPGAGSESSNLVRMRSQSLGKSAPSLTANLFLAFSGTRLGNLQKVFAGMRAGTEGAQSAQKRELIGLRVHEHRTLQQNQDVTTARRPHSNVRGPYTFKYPHNACEAGQAQGRAVEMPALLC